MNKSLVYLSLLAMGVMLGCGGGSGNSSGGGGGGVTVTIAPRSVNLPITVTQQFTATVTGASNTAVNWAVSGSGCTGAACGTISSTGLYTAPSSIPSPATVTVMATSVADSTKSDHVNVTLVHISVSVAPNSATVALNGTQQFSATASPSNAPQTVNWTVAAGSGTTCNGSCGTVVNGLYTAPATLPTGNPPKVVVTATSTVDTAGVGNATVTLVSTFNSRLKGTYGFHFSGSDAVSTVLSVGNLVADGSGNISSGLVDMSRSSGPQSLTVTSGSYNVGSDSRGTMTLNTSGGTLCYAFALGANGETAFVEFDHVGTCTATLSGVGVRGSGILDQVSNAASLFKNSVVSGPFVFGFDGADANGKKTGYVGVFTGDGAGNVTTGLMDINDAGTVQAISSLSGTYTVAATGRGTMTINAAGVANPINLAFYPVGSSELFFVATDPVVTNPRITGVAIGQDTTVPFNNSTLSGTGVFELTGVDSTGAFTDVAAGLATADGSGNVSGVFDENNGGSVSSNSSYIGAYSASGSGRYTITLLNDSFVLYAVTSNKGFLIDQSSSVLSGFMEPQGNSPFTSSSIQGTFVAITVTVANTQAEDIVAALSLTASNGSVSGTQDETNASSQNPNQMVMGSYTVSSNGRGTLSFTAPSSKTRTIYIIGNSKFVAVGTDAGDQNSTVITAER